MLPTIRLEPCAGQRRKLRQGSCPCVWQVGRQSMPSAEAAVSQAGPSLCPLPSRGVERVGLGSGRTARGQRSSGLGPGGVLSDRNPSPPAPVPRSWGKGLPTPPRGTAQKRGLCSPSDPTRGGHLGSTGDKLRQGRACSLTQAMPPGCAAALPCAPGEPRPTCPSSVLIRWDRHAKSPRAGLERKRQGRVTQTDRLRSARGNPKRTSRKPEVANRLSRTR